MIVVRLKDRYSSDFCLVIREKPPYRDIIQCPDTDPVWALFETIPSKTKVKEVGKTSFKVMSAMFLKL